MIMIMIMMMIMMMIIIIQLIYFWCGCLRKIVPLYHLVIFSLIVPYDLKEVVKHVWYSLNCFKTKKQRNKQKNLKRNKFGPNITRYISLKSEEWENFKRQMFDLFQCLLLLKGCKVFIFDSVKGNNLNSC